MKRHSSVFGFLPIPQVLLPPSDSSPRFVFLPRAVTPIISRGVHIMHRKREIAHEYYKLAHHPRRLSPAAVGPAVLHDLYHLLILEARYWLWGVHLSRLISRRRRSV